VAVVIFLPFPGEGYAKGTLLADLVGIRFVVTECLQNIGAYSNA
jgi:hypothetical protein